MRRPTPLLLLSSLVLSLAGCAGDGPEPIASGTWFARLQVGVFDQNCTSAGCHNPQSNAAGLILTAQFSYDALIGVTPTTPAAAQAGLELVRPFDPDTSFLLIKLLDPGPGQGSRMPQGAEPLSREQIETVRAWIEAGAPRFDVEPTPSEPTATPSPTELPATPTATATAIPTAAPASPTVTAPVTAPPTAEATPTATEPAVTPDVTLEQVQDEIFTPRCAVQFCHSGPFAIAQLNLEEGQSFAEMVNVVPLTAAAANAGMLLVDPGNVANSFLYTKITNPVGDQGFIMPLTGERLSESEIQLVRDWIEGL